MILNDEKGVFRIKVPKKSINQSVMSDNLSEKSFHRINKSYDRSMIVPMQGLTFLSQSINNMHIRP